MTAPHVPLELVGHDGARKFAAVQDCEHATLCAAFNLDPASTRFDLPATMRDPVKLHASFRAGRGSSRDRVFGFVHRGEKREPIGMLHVLPKEGVRHRELYGWASKVNDT